ncbi:MAG: hypothetical protein PHU87_04140 [Methanocorpusculum sp.]|nr:hypothetical protein [Methanocorpusculum sp.]
MADLSGVDPTSWFFILGFIVICFIIIIIVSKLEEKYNNKLLEKKQKMIQENVREMTGILSKKEGAQQAFVAGQVYRMEDGTLARYAKDGKFYRIKEE